MRYIKTTTKYRIGYRRGLGMLTRIGQMKEIIPDRILAICIY